MLARILFVSDLHKKYTDSSSIHGQVEVFQKIEEDIIEFVKRNGVTHVVILGDWYDRGFHGLGPTFGSMELDRRLSKAVEGNVFLCIGNHFYLERDENPEMYLIQPNALIKPQSPIPMPERPIFQVEQKLKIGTVQINLFHYNKINKNYVAYRDEDTTYNIGVYHDDSVIPGWVREKEGFTGASTQSYMNSIYDNIDFAIHGHIHSKIGICSIELNSGRKVPMCIPGSLGIIQNKEVFKHKEVSLPILDITEDPIPQLHLCPFSTYLDELKFYTPKKKKKKEAAVSVDTSKAGTLVPRADLQSLAVYMHKKGYGKKHMKLIDAALANKLDIMTAITIISEVDELNG